MAAEGTSNGRAIEIRAMARDMRGDWSYPGGREGHDVMGQRPAHVKPPAYLSKSPPMPRPDAPQSAEGKGDVPVGEEARPDPVRYGDWESKGIAVDF